MAVTLSLTTVKLSSIAIPSLYQAIISYMLGYTDAVGVYHDVMVDNGPTTVLIPLDAGSPIPAASELAGAIAQDVAVRFGLSPDVVNVNGVDHVVTGQALGPASAALAGVLLTTAAYRPTLPAALPAGGALDAVGPGATTRTAMPTAGAAPAPVRRPSRRSG